MLYIIADTKAKQWLYLLGDRGYHLHLFFIIHFKKHTLFKKIGIEVLNEEPQREWIKINLENLR